MSSIGSPQLIEGGAVVPSIDQVYPLADAPVGTRHLSAGNVRGKVAISIWPTCLERVGSSC
jgi:NADPH:quinone reductase-like Zn-dependent oxidoreductase